MNPLHAAISARRNKSGAISEAEGDSGGDKDLHGLVASLNDGEKQKLKDLLNHSSKATEISKGGSSSEEDQKIRESMDEENAENSLEQGQEHEDQEQHVDSDEIGKSMLDSRFMGANAPSKPRNLGERVKIGIANKLKAKGKI